MPKNSSLHKYGITWSDHINKVHCVYLIDSYNLDKKEKHYNKLVKKILRINFLLNLNLVA